MENRFTWGVIGSIGEANAFAVDLIHATTARHEVVAVCTEEPADELETTSLQYYQDLVAFLESDIEAVYIAGPYQQHYAFARQCLLYHKPVLCERPVATDTEEMQYLLRLSQAHHTFLMEGMWVRFLPSIKKVLSIVSSGAIGDIISIKASVNYKNTQTASGAPYKGTALFELGTYPVFLCVLFLGQPDYVQSAGSTTGQHAHQFFSAFLSYIDGQYAFIEASTLRQGSSYAILEGNKGQLQIKNPWSAKPEGIEVDLFDGSKVLHKSGWEGRGLQFEADEVYKCVKENRLESQLYPQQFSLDVMKTLDDIRQKIK